MNDLQDLRDFGRRLDQEILGPSPDLRRRLLGAFAQPPNRARRPRSGIGQRVAIAGGIAVALATGLLIAPVPWWGSHTATDARAAQILAKAALAARQQPEVRPRPSQFVFIKELVEFASVSVRHNGTPRVTLYPELSEVWSSVSGARKGLARNQPRSSPLPGHPTGPWQISHNGAPHSPSYLRGLPTSAEAMLRYLYRHRMGQNPPAQEAYITAGDLIRGRYIPPAALAAVFEAVAKIPGVKVVHGAVTINGTRGIAVQRIFGGESYQLIFNPRTHAFIGEREVVVSRARTQMKVGTVLYSTTILRVAIVDHAGQQP